MILSRGCCNLQRTCTRFPVWAEYVGTEVRGWLDQQPRVLWWTRNLPRPNASDDWSARIVLPDSGRGYYPDFVVCVEGRRKPDGIALTDTKERIESEDSAAKSRSEHREYGRALMVSYDANSDRFLRVEFAPDLRRNREVGPLRPETS